MAKWAESSCLNLYAERVRYGHTESKLLQSKLKALDVLLRPEFALPASPSHDATKNQVAALHALARHCGGSAQLSSS
jgi:hypothetical protein